MEPEPQDRVEVELDAVASAPAEARAAVDAVTLAIPGDVGFRAGLAVSELVANSVSHADDDVGVGRIRVVALRTEGHVRVEVQDGGDAFDASVRDVSVSATSGRGLQLVDAITDRWGVEHGGGNHVWFEIDRPSDDRRSGSPLPRDSLRRREAPQQPPAPTPEHRLAAVAAAVLARAVHYVREGWCQGADARDAFGSPVEPWADDAFSWSLLGAIVAAIDGPAAIASGDLPPTALAAAMTALAELIAETSLQGWNDAPHRTQGEVIDVLERARMLLRPRRVTT